MTLPWRHAKTHIHTHTHTHIHTLLHSHADTPRHTHTPYYTPMPICTDTHTHTHPITLHVDTHRHTHTLLHSHADTHTHTHLVCTCMSIHTHTSMSSTRLFYSMSCSWAISTSPSQVLVSVNSDLDGFHLRCPILALLRCPLQLASELALLCSHSSQLSNSLVQMGLNALFLLLSSCWSLHFIRHSFVWSLDSVFWRSSVLAEVALLEFVSDFLPFVPWQGRQALNDDSKDGEVQ